MPVIDILIFYFSNNIPQPDTENDVTNLRYDHSANKTTISVPENSNSSDTNFITDERNVDSTQRTTEIKQRVDSSPITLTTIITILMILKT